MRTARGTINFFLANNYLVISHRRRKLGYVNIQMSPSGRRSFYVLTLSYYMKLFKSFKIIHIVPVSFDLGREGDLVMTKL